jgi:sarcosine oxidase delta subunit
VEGVKAWAGDGWQKCSYCESGTCVEIRNDGDAILVRATALPAHVVSFTPAEWEVFLLGVKNGEFDL